MKLYPDALYYLLRSCGTLQRAIDFVNLQGPIDKSKDMTKELDSISTASTIVSLGRIVDFILIFSWHAFAFATHSMPAGVKIDCTYSN